MLGVAAGEVEEGLWICGLYVDLGVQHSCVSEPAAFVNLQVQEDC